MMRFLAMLLAATALAGCFHVRYTNDTPVAAEPAEQNWHHNVVFGLVEVSEPVNVNKACPGGVGLVKSEESFVAGLVNVITLTLYNPSDVIIYCSATK
jgi:outer membrane lipoprotein SlyB